MARRGKVNKKRHECGHLGFGKYCHRCDQGDMLLTFAEAGKKFITNKKNPDKKLHKVWTVEQLKAESDRLLESATRYLNA